jgi:hypothetical protein
MSATDGNSAAVEALETVLARSAQLAEATWPLRHALTQTDCYTDLRDRQQLLAAMSAAEALLVLALLERHAETLQRGELGEQLLRAAHGSEREREQAIDAGRHTASLSAARWLRDMPLHRALTERASQ